MWVQRTLSVMRAAGIAAVLVSTSAAIRAQECAYLGATENFNSIAYCVSSVLRASSGKTYGPENLFDMRPETAWCEGARGSGVGEILTLRIDGGGPFRRIFIENGYQKTRELFDHNARPMALEIRTDTGQSFIHVLDDGDIEQMIDLPEPAEYRVVQFRVLDVYRGSRHEDMCISTILVDFDHEKYFGYEEQSVSPDRGDVLPDPEKPGKPVLPIPKLPDLPKL